MLQSLLIQNFQAHSRTRIDFDPITIIVGPTDAGKSAIIRALKWVCLNTPQGDKFIKWGQPGTTVKLMAGDCTVVRKRGKDVNEYLLGIIKEGGVEYQTYKSFSSDVPQPIKDALGMTWVNFQGQFDAPFWFSESAGQVSKNLNSIVNLELMDETLSVINAQVVKAREGAEAAELALSRSLARKKALVWVKEADDDLKYIEEKAADILCESLKLTALTMAVDRLKGYELARDRASAQGLALDRVAEAGKCAGKAAKDLQTLQGMVDSIKKLRATTAPDITTLDAAFTRLEQVSSKRRGLVHLLEEIKSKEEEKSEAEAELTRVESEIDKKSGGLCPLCGGPLDDSTPHEGGHEGAHQGAA